MGKREITLPMKLLSSKVLNLGYVDENLHTRVIIDCSEVLWDYPGATVDMVVRPPRGDLYPVTPDRDNNNNIIWDITANDLVYAGTGQLQLTFTDSGEIIKSIVGTTKVLPSLETTGEAPEPLQNWMDAAEQTAEQIAEAAAAGVVGELIDDTAGAGATTKTWSASKISGAVGAKVDEPSSEGTDGQVLATDGSGGRYWRTVSGGGGGGGGTTDYSELTNKPQINSITLTGNKSLSDLGIAAASSVPDVSGKADKVSNATNGHFAGLDGNGNLTDSGKSASDFGTYSKPSGGIPSTDMTSAVQTSLGKANSAYQKPGNGIPSTDLTQAVQTSLGKADTAYQKPVSGIPATDLANSYIKEPTSDGTSGQVLATNGSGTRYWTTVQGGTGGTTDYSDLTNKPQVNSVTLSGNKSLSDLGVAPASKVYWATPEDYGAVGDGVTDDSQAIQDACDACDDVYFASGKTYYLANPVSITHDCHLHGGKDTVIKFKKVTANEQNCFAVSGTLKKTTSLTTDYTTVGTTANSGNQFTLSDMTGISIGDVMVVQATDQYYSYERQYYYLGMTLLISDIYNGHIYTTNSIPFGITNTQNTTVKIYSAPQAIVENLKFVSDISNQDRWYYSWLLSFINCKNSIVRNCDFSEFCMGIQVYECVNTLVDNVTMSKSKYDNTISGDGYGVEIASSSDTTVNRLFTVCAQNGLDLTGTHPNVNTYVYNSNINAECRGNGLGMHENSYNIVVEDCVLGGCSFFGTATVNRCRIIKNNRPGIDVTSLTVYGSHNPEWARFRITNCVIDTDNYICAYAGTPQTPVQSIDSVVGSLEISNCYGGAFKFVPTLNSGILSCKIQSVVIDNWQNCYEFYHTTFDIDSVIIKDSTFTKAVWMTKHTDAFYTDYIGFLRIMNSYPQTDKLCVKNNIGGTYYLSENTGISFSSSDTSAHYVVCGENIISNKVADFSVGGVSGAVGSALTRTVDSNFSTALSVNSSGELVYTQPNNTTKHDIYPKCLMYVKDACEIRMSCKLKNTGSTSGAGFRAFLAVVDAKTGLVTYRNNGVSAEATASGAVVTHARAVNAGSYVLAYLYCYSPVANAETTFSEFVAKTVPYEDYNSTLTYEQYAGSSRDGDGTLQSVAGQNNIMVNASSTATISFSADLLKREPLTSATGVSF